MVRHHAAQDALSVVTSTHVGHCLRYLRSNILEIYTTIHNHFCAQSLRNEDPPERFLAVVHSELSEAAFPYCCFHLKS